MAFKRADWDGVDMWYGWENRGYLRKCYAQNGGRPRPRRIDGIRKGVEMRGENR